MNDIVRIPTAPDWWPLCAVCGKVVDGLEAGGLPVNADIYHRAIRHYTVLSPS